MIMNMKKIAMLLLTAAWLVIAMTVSAQTKPRWVQKGVRSLNRECKDGSYRFHAFRTSGADLSLLESGRFEPLKEELAARYGVATDRMQLDSMTGDGRTTYRISFPDGNGRPAELFAQLVDDWARLDDDVSKWGFEFHQLYAVSEPDAAPAFDNFSVTHRYGVKPVLMSIIPGLGQIRKGQAGKGYAILGTEVLLIGGTVYSAVEMSRYNRLARNNPSEERSYRSKASTFRSMRNTCLILAGGLYIYNLVDAAVARGARHVVIRRDGNPDAELAFAPVVTEHCAGAGMSIRF